jgi:hypothetical protein
MQPSNDGVEFRSLSTVPGVPPDLAYWAQVQELIAPQDPTYQALLRELEPLEHWEALRPYQRELRTYLQEPIYPLKNWAGVDLSWDDLHLCIWNLGMGQNSSVWVAKLIASGRRQEEKAQCPDADLREMFPADPRLLVLVFANTGREWPETYLWAQFLQTELAKLGYPLIVLDKSPRSPYQRDAPVILDQIFQPNEDTPLAGRYRGTVFEDYSANDTIPTRKARSCTVKGSELRAQDATNHKIRPIRRWVSAITQRLFGVSTRDWSRQGLPAHHNFIGYDIEEESRRKRSGQSDVKYMDNRFPLMDWGFGRVDCQEAIKRTVGRQAYQLLGFYYPPKSGCTLCPFQPKIERFLPIGE